MMLANLRSRNLDDQAKARDSEEELHQSNGHIAAAVVRMIAAISALPWKFARASFACL
jgi:hypothetical protein